MASSSSADLPTYPLDQFIVTPQCFAPDAGQGGDDHDALQRWLDDPRATKLLPARNGAAHTAAVGPYRTSATLILQRGHVRILGAGPRGKSVIHPHRSWNTAAGEPLLQLGKDTSVPTSGIILEGVGFDGRDADNAISLATAGVLMRCVNFSHLTDVAIRNVAGVGLDLFGVQDSQFSALDVRRCGAYDDITPGDSRPAVLLRNQEGDDFFDTNSVVFLGGDFERNKHSGCLIRGASAIGFVRTKFHGRLVDDEEADSPGSEKLPDAVDLLVLEGATRITVNSCQFTNARRFAIRIANGTLNGRDTVSTATITGNTFTESANYSGPADAGQPPPSSPARSGQSPLTVFNPSGVASAWNIVVEAARVMISDNYFGHGSHPSYTKHGGDIWLTADAKDAGGQNLHHGLGGEKVRHDAQAAIDGGRISGVTKIHSDQGRSSTVGAAAGQCGRP